MMPNEFQNFLRTIIRDARPRPETVTETAWGKSRTFTCYDLYDDTFILEQGIEDHLENKDSIVLIPKAALMPGDGQSARIFGNVMTLSSGNHAVTGIPLLSGRFWRLSTLATEEEQMDVLAHRMVCANCVGDTIELSQRQTPTSVIVEMDEWLQALGYPMRKIVLIDRIDETLEFYEHRGQEWRIKPLAWTPEEMQSVINGSVSRIHSPIRYYHNVQGVHFLTYTNFLQWGALIEKDFRQFLSGLSELCGTSPDQKTPNLLLPKYASHHEIEFFGPPPGIAIKTLVPRMMAFYGQIKALDPNAPETARSAAEFFNAISQAFFKLLGDSAYADDKNPKLVEDLYRYLCGAVYHNTHDFFSRAFDDMRTALPGATYSMGNRFIHEGTDQRSIAILDALELNIGHGNHLEYVNIYELRSLSERVRLGDGKTREIVYKTAWGPIPSRLIEKRLAQRSTGYGAYTLVRASAFRALGISYGKHRMLARNDGAAGDVHYFTRSRYPGQPFSQLPASRFHERNPQTGVYDTEQESADIVRALIRLMGLAAAENIILKKYMPDGSCRFAEGKEIIEFGYDVHFRKEMPLRIHLCSIRGTLGWPDRSRTQENLRTIANYYLNTFARVTWKYAQNHPIIEPWDLADAFWEGFAARTHEIAWNYTVQRKEFDHFRPRIFGDFKFQEKWEFALWALERQNEQISDFSEIFHDIFRRLLESGGDDPPPCKGPAITTARPVTFMPHPVNPNKAPGRIALSPPPLPARPLSLQPPSPAPASAPNPQA